MRQIQYFEIVEKRDEHDNGSREGYREKKNEIVRKEKKKKKT